MTILIDQDTKVADILAAARKDGEVRLRSGSGEEYVVRQAAPRRALRDLPTIGVHMTAAEIVAAVRESRERDYTPKSD